VSGRLSCTRLQLFLIVACLMTLFFFLKKQSALHMAPLDKWWQSSTEDKRRVHACFLIF